MILYVFIEERVQPYFAFYAHNDLPCQPLSDHETSFKDSNFKRFSEDHAPDPLEARPSAFTFAPMGLSLDPIDLSPFGHLMKFRQRSFPLYKLGLSTAFYRLSLSTAFTD